MNTDVVEAMPRGTGEGEPARPVFVLGARDPEMRLMERILAAADVTAVPATRNGRRVYPGNAYRADPPPIDRSRPVLVHAVECAWSPERGPVRRIDHHHPGDPGYGRPPREFFEASSVGQLLAALREHFAVRGEAAEFAALEARFGAEARITAAADHCLRAACQGECPGVDPAALLAWLARSRAHFQGRSEAAVLADIAASRATIRRLATDGLADLRGLPGGTLPEAPEAACLEGIAVLTRQIDRDGREKIGLLGAEPQQVRAFLDGTLVPGLEGLYGDPARGFAGGYRQRR